MKFKNPLLLLMLLIFPSLSPGQQEIKITDPDIEFTLEMPEGWEQSDDGLYLLLSPPGGAGHEVLSITYFDTPFSSVKENFETAIAHTFPNEVPGFELVETGVEEIGGAEAHWAVYDSEEESVPYTTLIYYFTQSGQMFNVKAQARKENFENYRKKFVEVINSLRSERV